MRIADLTNKPKPMINPNEVRIDNLVRYKGKEYRIEMINPFLATLLLPSPASLKYLYVEWKDLEPIELSEEWLIKMKFDVCDAPDFHWRKLADKVYVKGGLAIFQQTQSGVLFDEKTQRTERFTHVSIQYGNGHGILTEINSLDQLQNLYFALTGNELTLSESV